MSPPIVTTRRVLQFGFDSGSAERNVGRSRGAGFALRVPHQRCGVAFRSVGGSLFGARWNTDANASAVPERSMRRAPGLHFTLPQSPRACRLSLAQRATTIRARLTAARSVSYPSPPGSRGASATALALLEPSGALVIGLHQGDAVRPRQRPDSTRRCARACPDSGSGWENSSEGAATPLSAALACRSNASSSRCVGMAEGASASSW